MEHCKRKKVVDQIELDLRAGVEEGIFSDLPLRLMHLRDACEQLANDARPRGWNPDDVVAAFNEIIEEMTIIGPKKAVIKDEFPRGA